MSNQNLFCLLACWLSLPCLSTATLGQLAEEPIKHQESFVRIIAVRGNQISVVESAGGRGRRGGSGMPGQDSTPKSAMGRRGRMQGNSSSSGRRGGRGGSSSGQQAQSKAILTVGRGVQVTYALQERRTNEFRVGKDINGGLRNEIFRRLPDGGLSARIVTDGKRLIAINVIQANDTSLDDIAVKPKRPLRKK